MRPLALAAALFLALVLLPCLLRRVGDDDGEEDLASGKQEGEAGEGGEGVVRRGRGPRNDRNGGGGVRRGERSCLRKSPFATTMKWVTHTRAGTLTLASAPPETNGEAMTKGANDRSYGATSSFYYLYAIECKKEDVEGG